MALGKNLKHKKLISEEEKPASEKKQEKKPIPKKKKLIADKTAKKTIAKKKKAEGKKKSPKTNVSGSQPSPTKKEAPVGNKQLDSDVLPSHTKESVDSTLLLYIAKELKERKRQLRERYQQEIASLKGKNLQFIIFKIAGETYAIDIDTVKEVVPLPALSKAPNTPAHIKGIANVRGETFVVFDLAKRFHLEAEETFQYLLTLKSKKVKAGLVLPQLPSTFKTTGDSISTDMDLIEDASLDVSYIKGLIKEGDNLIYYLDVIEMLSSDKAVVIPDELLNERT